MKRLVVCCDGTWQSLKTGHPTNVVRIAQLISPLCEDEKTVQVVRYDPGVGTSGPIDRLTGGGFGHGLDDNIREVYRFLALNYLPGDEIFLFGFSRGAYTVRSLAGLIYASGLVKRKYLPRINEAMALYRDNEIRPDDDEAKAFRAAYAAEPDITFLGCWDTVGALGVPDVIPFLPIDDWLREGYEFHDTELNPRIQRARHALAIDERRRAFEATHMQTEPDDRDRVVELWFPGTHGCVGGGTKSHQGLSDGALRWMMEEAAEVGLEYVDAGDGEMPKPDPTVPFHDNIRFPFSIVGTKLREIDPPTLHRSVLERWRGVSDYRPDNLPDLTDATAADPEPD